MTGPRLFTREEAERTLPLVRRILRDLMLAHPEWRRAVGRYELLAAGARADEGETPELAAARRDVEAHAAHIQGFLAELEQLGCAFKDFEEGLVDFHALHGDRVVLLCWRYGEERITHWHELDAGFAGRQPIDASWLTEVES